MNWKYGTEMTSQKIFCTSICLISPPSFHVKQDALIDQMPYIVIDNLYVTDRVFKKLLLYHLMYAMCVLFANENTDDWEVTHLQPLLLVILCIKVQLFLVFYACWQVHMYIPVRGEYLCIRDFPFILDLCVVVCSSF